MRVTCTMKAYTKASGPIVDTSNFTYNLEHVMIGFIMVNNVKHKEEIHHLKMHSHWTGSAFSTNESA